jgi:phage recombination protein Bet
MSNELAKVSEDELIYVLQTSLYVGASIDSVKMVLSYCKAANLDVMQKPVHIVPMWNSKEGRMIDVVMPGVGLYRIQASRTGGFAGMSEPEFGPMITQTIGGKEITFPEFARCTAKRTLPSGGIAEFSAIEYWMENYAVKGGKEKSIAPNSMWEKRPRGQIGKCAQAQALRLAFPELGAMPTAEEMEGKTVYSDEIDITPTKPVAAVINALEECSQEKFDLNKGVWREMIITGKKTPGGLIAMLSTKAILTEAQKLTIDSWSHEND